MTTPVSARSEQPPIQMTVLLSSSVYLYSTLPATFCQTACKEKPVPDDLPLKIKCSQCLWGRRQHVAATLPEALARTARPGVAPSRPRRHGQYPHTWQIRRWPCAQRDSANHPARQPQRTASAMQIFILPQAGRPDPGSLPRVEIQAFLINLSAI